MPTRIRFVALLLPLLASLGCSAYTAKMSGYGSAHRVILYSGGQAVKTWVSKGKVATESESDGYFFEDRETGKLIEVSGDVVIEQL